MRSRLHLALLVLAIGVAWPGIATAGEDEPTTTAPPTGTPTAPPPTTIAPGEEALGGTLTESGEPVEGVTIRVEGVEGNPVGEAVTAEDGTWRIPVPEPGRYQVTIDVDTLPRGVDLRDEKRATLEIPVFPGRPSVALFALGELDTGGRPSTLERLAQSSVNGVKFGLIVAMTSIGLSLIFGTTGLINFAHGELVTFGAILAWFLNARGPNWQLILAGVAAAAIAGLLGGALEWSVWRPLRRRQVGLFQLFVITIGLSLLVRHALLIWFGGQRRQFTDYTIQKEWELGPVSITPRDLTIMIASIVILVAVATMLQRTRIGKALRAVSDDIDLSEASGIDVQRVILVVWVAGAALAATGGIFLGTIEAVDWEMGTRLLLLMFSAVILGGLGTAYGAMVGGLVVGLVTEVSTIWVSPALKIVFALAALVLALLVRPQGLLGRKERIG